MWGTGISFSLGFGKATDELWDGTRFLGLGTLTPWQPAAQTGAILGRDLSHVASEVAGDIREFADNI